MRFNLDEYAYLNSPLHRWEPRYKLLGLVALIFAFASVQHLVLVPLILGITALVYGLSRLPLTFLYQRLCYPGYFILGVVVLLPWLSGETVIWHWQGLTLYGEGLRAMALISGRFLAIVTMSLILCSTTPFLVMVKTLRALGLPPLLVDMLLLTYRYLFELSASLHTMRRAMTLRGFLAPRPPAQRPQPWPGRSPFTPFLTMLKQLAALAGTLLIRSYEQAERIYQAMRLRGYGYEAVSPGPGRSLWAFPQNDRWDQGACGASLVLALGLVVLNLGLG